MSMNAKRHTAAVAFVALLLLALFWPAPVLTVNDVCCHAHLPIDDLSFLGREAPSWDVVYWCVAGIFLIALLQTAESRDFGEARRIVRSSVLGPATSEVRGPRTEDRSFQAPRERPC